MKSKLISTDIKTDVKQKIKKQEITFHISPFSKLKYKIKHACIFHLIFGWHSIQFDPLSVTKDIC